MDCLTLIRQGVLFVHLLAFAIALSAVLREDLALLTAKRLDTARLNETAQWVGRSLLVLWITGFALVALDCGFDWSSFVPSAKLKAKFLVVVLLTLNGLMLHTLAFPWMRARSAKRSCEVAAIAAAGAISTASWLYASFLGVSRAIAPMISFTGFMGLYGIALTLGVSIALVFVRPRIEQLLCGRSEPIRLTR